MIKLNLKPTERQVVFTEPTENTGRLQITVSIYDEPIMQTGEVDIYTIVDVKEEFGGEYIEYGQWLYPSIFTDKQIKESFDKIKSDPSKFKNKKNEKESSKEINN